MAGPSALRSARLPVNLIGSPINYANRLIGYPITSQSTARPPQEPIPDTQRRQAVPQTGSTRGTLTGPGYQGNKPRMPGSYSAAGGPRRDSSMVVHRPPAGVASTSGRPAGGPSAALPPPPLPAAGYTVGQQAQQPPPMHRAQQGGQPQPMHRALPAGQPQMPPYPAFAVPDALPGA